MNTSVDFFVIGAQKAGTTALHLYLKEHPAIFVPVQKETAFFFFDHLYEQGTDWYLKRYFSDARSDQIVRGEVSPQYMYGWHVPERIAKCYPQARLIAVLRNPIDRAFSAHRMNVRRGLEHRSFDAIVAQSTSMSVAEVLPTLDDENNNYLSAGCYGSILNRYLEFFDRSQIEVVFSEELESNTRAIMRRLLTGLGVDPNFESPVWGKRYHEGGVVRSNLVKEYVLTPNPARRVLKHVIPARYREALRYWIENWNIRRVEPDVVAPSTREALATWYRGEVEAVSRSFGVEPNWSDFLPAGARLRMAADS